jgi:hypothetical protein
MFLKLHDGFPDTFHGGSSGAARGIQVGTRFDEDKQLFLGASKRFLQNAAPSGTI